MTFVVVGLAVLAAATAVPAAEYYVSATGKGKAATKDKPAKDLGNIISKLAPGDVVNIAGGFYTGKGDNGCDDITVPVSIIGGWDETFTKRDPWGATQTVLGGDNKTKNWEVGARLRLDLSKYKGKEMPEIVIDGIIVDQATQNRYADEKQLKIMRLANPKTGENPTPDRGGLVVSLSKSGNFDAGAKWVVKVRNCIVVNSAPTQGALAVWGYKDSDVTISDNVVINCTGIGIHALSSFHGDANFPTFLIERNTVLFTWKYDAMASSYSGVGLQIDSDLNATARDNVIGFSDRIGIQKSGKLKLLLQRNTVVGSLAADYYEATTDIKMGIDDIEDEAENLADESADNGAGEIKAPVSEAWARNWASRAIIDRNAVEADIKAANTRMNAIRGMLGIPLQAGTQADVSGDVWLPRLSLEDAIKVAHTRFNDRGAQAPK